MNAHNAAIFFGAVAVFDVVAVAFLWWRGSRIEQLDRSARPRREYPRLAERSALEESEGNSGGTSERDAWDRGFI